MAKILCLVLPLPAHINIHSLLAKSLQSRGHEVIFGSMKDAQPRLEAFGLTCIPFFEKRLPAGLMQDWLTGDIAPNTLGQKLQFLLNERRKIIHHEKFVEYLTGGGYREFVDAVKALRPDLILVDNGLHTYWALMARATGIRCLYTSAMLPIVEDPIIPPLNSPLMPANGPDSARAVKAAWDSYFSQRRRRTWAMRLAGIPDPIANFRRLARATGCQEQFFNSRTLLFPQLDFPVLIACPEEFEFPEALNHDGIHYVESLINLDRPEPDFPWEKLDPSKQLIFCSLGSVAFNQPFFQSVLDAAAREHGWQVVVNVGSKISPEMFARVPNSAILVRGAPQLGLLKRAHAMINHGGINSVRECIYFGVPQLVFPLFFDQFGAAARVEYHRLGLTGNFANASPENLHALLSRLLGKKNFRARSIPMSASFQEREREKVACRVIESYLPATS